jgi:hypothetical protein
MKALLIAALAIISMACVEVLSVSAAPDGYHHDQKVVHHNEGGGPITPPISNYSLAASEHINAAGKDHVEIRVVARCRRWPIRARNPNKTLATRSIQGRRRSVSHLC